MKLPGTEGASLIIKIMSSSKDTPSYIYSYPHGMPHSSDRACHVPTREFQFHYGTIKIVFKWGNMVLATSFYLF
jgi:hypothetical protein